jgi:hypothetical protein
MRIDLVTMTGPWGSIRLYEPELQMIISTFVNLTDDIIQKKISKGRPTRRNDSGALRRAVRRHGDPA